MTAQTKKIGSNRMALAVLGTALVVIWMIFGIATLAGNNRGHYVGGDPQRQRDAHDKLQSGQRLSDTDVADLAARQEFVSPEEEQSAGLKLFGCCSVVAGLPGAALLGYLLLTRPDKK